MADKVPSKPKEAFVQQLSDCFGVDRNVIRAVLDSEKWNMEKCLQVFETLSPKAGKTNNKGPDNKAKASGGKGKEKDSAVNEKEGKANVEKVKGKENSGNKNKASEAKGNDNNKKKESQNDSKKKNAGAPPNNANTKQNKKTTKDVTVKKDVKVEGPDSESWTFIEIDKKGSQSKTRQRRSKTKGNPPLNTGSAPTTPSETPSRPKGDIKKKKRTLLKSAYSIIEQKQNEVDRIRDCIKCEIRVLVLMRGCPGSGKSTFARQILLKSGISNPELHIFSTDNFFVNSKGVYNYDKMNLQEAHSWNQNLVEKVMKMGFSPVIVDNTHIEAWEMMPYVKYAMRQGYVLETLQPPTPWFFNETILAKKNTHCVPKSKIAKMLESYEPNLSGIDLFKKFNLEYIVSQSPPQVVSYSKEQVLLCIKKMMVGKMQLSEINKSADGKQNKKQNGKLNSPISNQHPDIEIIRQIPIKKGEQMKPNSQLPAAGDSSRQSSNNLWPYPSNPFTYINTGASVSKDNEANSPVKLTSPSTNLPSKSLSYMAPPSFEESRLKEIFDPNILDSSIDGTTGKSVINPLQPALSGIGFESRLTNDISTKANNATIALDPADFPSLSKTPKSQYVQSKTELFEEKVKHVTELFPYLDETYVKDLCEDPNQNLDGLIESLLSLNTSVDSDLPSKAGCSYAVSKEELTAIAGLTDIANNDDNNQNSESEKDINMLVQLFPNVTETKVRETYVKCQKDFRVTLEELLNDGPSEVASDTSDSEDCEDFDKEAEPDTAVQQDSANSESVDDVLFSSSIDEMMKSFNKYFNNMNQNSDKPTVEMSKSKSDDQLGSLLKDKLVITESSKASNNEVERKENIDFNISCEKFDGKESEANKSTSQDSSHATEGESKAVLNNISLDTFKTTMENAMLTLSKQSTTLSESADQPELNDLAKVSSQNPNSKLLSKLFDWNFNENSIEKPLNKDVMIEPKIQREKYDPSTSVQHMSTNTNYKDFELLKKAESSAEIVEKVLQGSSDFVSWFKPLDQRVPANKLMLDKGTTTVEVEMGYVVSKDETGLLLADMFPNIPQSDLESLLKSCVGDLNWTVGLLLDSGHEISPNFNPSDHKIKVDNIADFSQSSEKSILKDLKRMMPSQNSDNSNTPRSKKRNSRTPIPVENINFIMNDDAMSDHLRKIRNTRLGICSEEDVMETSNLPSAPDFNFFNEEEREENMAVALNSNFILALQAQFGGFIPPIPEDSAVLVNLPVSLARQLHFSIMESLSQQLEEEDKLMNKIINEDECLARQLQDMENDGGNEHRRTLQEIMDEELSLNIHQNLNKGKSKGDTVASKLARQLLIERFPSMDPLALKSILDDTDNSLHQATHLLEAAGYKRVNPNPSPECISSMIEDDDKLTRDEAVEQANAYREAAKEFYEMRNSMFMKAQQAYSEGKKNVASYYSHMANWHNERIEQANLLASTILLTGNKNATTLDLHFLRVCEAIQVLDLFIDAHIRNLIEIKVKKCEVYLITGRGLHSQDGKAKIRPATMARLKQRSIVFQVVNPGLLKAFLLAKTPLTFQH